MSHIGNNSIFSKDHRSLHITQISLLFIGLMTFVGYSIYFNINKYIWMITSLILCIPYIYVTIVLEYKIICKYTFVLSNIDNYYKYDDIDTFHMACIFILWNIIIFTLLFILLLCDLQSLDTMCNIPFLILNGFNVITHIYYINFELIIKRKMMLHYDTL